MADISGLITNNVANTTVVSATKEGYDGEVILQANTGYKFNAKPKITYTDYYGDPFSVFGTLSGDKYTATFTLSDVGRYTDDFTITGAVVPDVPTYDYTVTQTLANCTTNAPVGVNRKDSITIVFTANEGYVFNPSDKPRVTYDDYDEGFPITQYATLSSDNKTATVTTNRIDSNVIVVATAIVDVPTGDYDVITDLVACTTNAPEFVNRKDVVTIVFTANEGYEFAENDKPLVSYTDYLEGVPVTMRATLSQDKKTATVTTGQIDSDLLVRGFAVLSFNGVTINTELTNATGNIPETADKGIQLTLSVSAVEGYEFADAPQINWVNEYGEFIARPFTVAEDKLTAVVTFTTPSDAENDTINVVAIATAITPYVDKYGAINVYVVTNENLIEFAQQRYIKEVNESTGEIIYNDLGDYVVKLHRVFAEIGATKQALIKAGRFTTDIVCQTPVNDVITTDFGTITIPTPNNDVTDLQSEIMLFLPFVGFVALDAPTYNGKEIALTYETNIVTGDAVARVSIDGVTLLMRGCKAIQDVLFRTYADKQIGQLDYNENVMQGLKPFVIVKYHETKNVAPFNDNTRAIIGTFNGVCKFDNVDGLNAENMTRNEYNEIINQLNNGITL